FTPKLKSSSFVVSKRLRCSSESTLYASPMHFSGVSTSYSVGVIEPSMRSSGGTPAVRCRSEAFRCTMSSSSCRSVSSGMSSSRSVWGDLQLVGRGFLEHFFHRGDPPPHLHQRVTAQREHPALHRRAFDLDRRRPLQDQVA